jgi:hypothetical protein
MRSVLALCTIAATVCIVSCVGFGTGGLPVRMQGLPVPPASGALGSFDDEGIVRLVLYGTTAEGPQRYKYRYFSPGVPSPSIEDLPAVFVSPPDDVAEFNGEFHVVSSGAAGGPVDCVRGDRGGWTAERVTPPSGGAWTGRIRLLGDAGRLRCFGVAVTGRGGYFLVRSTWDERQRSWGEPEPLVESTFTELAFAPIPRGDGETAVAFSPDDKRVVLWRRTREGTVAYPLANAGDVRGLVSVSSAERVSLFVLHRPERKVRDGGPASNGVVLSAYDWVSSLGARPEVSRIPLWSGRSVWRVSACAVQVDRGSDLVAVAESGSQSGSRATFLARVRGQWLSPIDRHLPSYSDVAWWGGGSDRSTGEVKMLALLSPIDRGRAVVELPRVVVFSVPLYGAAGTQRQSSEPL